MTQDNGNSPQGIPTVAPTLEQRIALLEAKAADTEAAKTVVLTNFELQRQAIETPLDSRYRHIAVRSFATEQERDYSEKIRDQRWPHIRPNSVMIAAMGFHWAPGSWQKICDMMVHAQSQGVYVALSELQDRCFEPYDALGTMRNEGMLMAINEGFDWILYVDNDVQPERDTLLRLLAWQMPIVTPYIAEPGTGKRLFGPGWDPQQGLKPLKWTVLSMLLCRVNAFRPFGSHFWEDAVGADEGYHFQKMWLYGHQPWMDTNTQLVVAGTPHYPLASNRLPRVKRDEMWDRINDKRNGPPDRKPIDPNGPHIVDSEYLPWTAPKPTPPPVAAVPVGGGAAPEPAKAPVAWSGA